MGEHKGALHSIETFGSVDGPGIRYVIFLQGCAMRCQFCHNADTWQMRNGEADAKDVLQRALRYRSYWRGGGGITVSGGEPLLQIDFLLELFEEAKKAGHPHRHRHVRAAVYQRRAVLFQIQSADDKHRPGAARHQAHRQ